MSTAATTPNWTLPHPISKTRNSVKISESWIMSIPIAIQSDLWRVEVYTILFASMSPSIPIAIQSDLLFYWPISSHFLVSWRFCTLPVLLLPPISKPDYHNFGILVFYRRIIVQKYDHHRAKNLKINSGKIEIPGKRDKNWHYTD